MLIEPLAVPVDENQLACSDEALADRGIDIRKHGAAL
jgi:hypothetical protein